MGRELELAEVLALLEVHRVVTLTGPGGAGKTRLALQAAAEKVEEYGDGVWFVSLAAVRDPRLIEPSISRVVGGPDNLHDFLASKRTLLVLDNVEQVLPEAAEIVARLDSRILATSRSRLNVAAEQTFAVPALSIDDATALFTQRARQLEPGFQPDATVQKIAERLDGLPLGLELAAARVRVLTPAQILERLGRSLDLLTSGTQDAPERQRTLRGTIEWSFELLAEDEQQLFARTAIFSGSFDLEAAEAGCAADLDVLQSLLDKSLLRHGADGRFFMLTTIKELALEKLQDSAENDSLRRSHDDHFLGVAEELERRERVSGRDLGEESLARFEYELPNFRATLAGLVDTNRHEDVLRLGAALWRFWLNKTQYRDAAEWLESATIDDLTASPETRATSLTAAGAIALYVHDDVDRAEAFSQAGLELRRAGDDLQEMAASLSRMASVAWRRDDFDGAIAYHKQAIPLFEQAGDEGGHLNELHFLGEAFRDGGDYDEGERLLEETASLARSLGRAQQLTTTLHSLGDLALDRKDGGAALLRFAEALDHAVDGGNRRVQVYCVAGIACALHRRGDDLAAARLWGIAEDQERQLGFRMLRNERRRYEELMAEARERLGNNAYEVEHSAGTGLTLEEAVAESRRRILV